MNNEKIKVGIIGSGRRGKAHSDSISKISDAELIAVSDLDCLKAEELGAQYGVEAYVGDDPIINHPDVNTVIIATPTPFHAGAVIKAAEKGMNIFCDKPLCRSMEEAEEIKKAVKKNGVPFCICFQRRFSWPESRIKELIPLLGSPKAGNAFYVHARYKRQRDWWTGNFEPSGGYTLDAMIHIFDLLRWYFGEIKDVYADGLLLAPDLPEPMDFTCANLTFENGFFASAQGGWIRRGVNINNWFYFTGSEGTIFCDGEVIKVSTRECEFEERGENVELPDLLLMKDFVNNLRLGKPVKPSLDDALKATKISLGSIQSIQERKANS